METEIRRRRRVQNRITDDVEEDEEEVSERVEIDQQVLLDNDQFALIRQVIVDSEIFQFLLPYIERFLQTLTQLKSRFLKPKPAVEEYKIPEPEISPEELFNDKLEQEEYEEALKIAKKFKLDTDIVYQRQWKSNPVTIDSISEVLSKVSKRSWIIQECLERVAKDIHAEKTLLNYGLKLTSLSSIASLTAAEKPIPSILLDERRFEEEKSPKARRDRENKLLNLIDFNALTLEQKQYCIWRIRLLHYLDYLKTYEYILGGPQVAHEHYIASFYETFRTMSGFEAAIHFARNANPRAVSALFTYYGDETLHNHLVILANFPETVPPFEYRNLLPECVPDCDYVEPWERAPLRVDKDWTDTYCSQFQPEVDLLFESEFYATNTKLLRYKLSTLTKSILTEWFVERALQIEENTGLISNSLELIKLAIERSVPDLGRLHDDLITFECLVYEAGCSTSLTFKEFQKLPNFEQMKLLMAEVEKKPEKFLRFIRQFLMPFLKKCEQYSSEKNTMRHLLHEYMIYLASNGLLSLCLEIFKASKLSKDNEDLELDSCSIITSEVDLLRFALDCIYACQSAEDLEHCFGIIAIIECLPERGDDVEMTDLHDKIDCVDKHLTTCDVFIHHGKNVLPSEIRTLQENSDVEGMKLLFRSVTRVAAKKTEPPLKEKDWLEMLNDLEEAYQLCFVDYIKEDFVREILVEALLCSGRKSNFGLAATFLHLDPDIKLKKRVIPYERSIDLLIGAAQEYINSSNSVYDDDITLARECLMLINEKEQQRNAIVSQELDFVKALYILNDDFNVNTLPIQVRICPQPKLEIIERALKSSSKSYEKTEKLLKLAEYLRACSDLEADEREGKILVLVAEAALENNDYKHCWSTCQRIMSNSYEPGWRVCLHLARSDFFNDLIAKYKLLCFSLAYCDDVSGDLLVDLVSHKSSIKQTIYDTTEELPLSLLKERLIKESVFNKSKRSIFQANIVPNVFSWMKKKIDPISLVK